MAKKAEPEITLASEEEFEAIKKLAAELVADGELSEDDVAQITKAVEEQDAKAPLSEKQRSELKKLVSEEVAANDPTTTTKGMRVFGTLSLLGGALTLVAMVLGALYVVENGTSLIAQYQGSTTELIFMVLQAVLYVAGAAVHVVLGVRLLKDRRYGAAQMATALTVIGVCDMFLESMLTGISWMLLFVTVVTAFRIALAVMLSPSLARERKLSENILMSDTKTRAENKTLGLDLSGKSFIKLDFFNVFWVFVVACFLGVVVEVIWHMVVVDPGVYQDRRGLLFGPFSPIYGIGAVLMTMALNRFKNAGLIVIFIVCTIIGGAFEYAVSWWLEMSFGVIAWDYHGQFLGDLFGGRTCLMFASMFGMLGLWWIKWALPRLLKLINLIPWKVRYVVTAICAVLMLFNIGMTLMALDCWQARVNGEPVVTNVQKYYAEHFDNDEMQSRFQSMTIKPQNKS